jgi:hypothetical protein
MSADDTIHVYQAVFFLHHHETVCLSLFLKTDGLGAHISMLYSASPSPIAWLCGGSHFFFEETGDL